MGNDTDRDIFKDSYHRYTGRKVLFMVVLILLIVILSGCSCMVSGRDITFAEGLRSIWDHIAGTELEYNSTEWWNDKLIWSNTMPRVVMALLAGSGLAVSGVIMQAILSNPLAEPYTMGVSSGVVLGANVAIILGFSIAGGIHTWGLVLNAFLFGLIPVGIILFLVRVLRSMSPVTMILSGVAISYFLSGLNTLMMVSTSSDKLSEAYRWQVGSLESSMWDEVQVAAVIVLSLTFVSLFLARYLNALSQGSNLAKSLGMDVERFRLVCMVMVTVMSAGILCFTGIIGFIGLLAPHIVRLIIGADNRYVIPASCLFGAVFLLFADTVTRLLTGVDIPVGAVMSFIGAPLFLCIVLFSKRKGVLY